MLLSASSPKFLLTEITGSIRESRPPQISGKIMQVVEVHGSGFPVTSSSKSFSVSSSSTSLSSTTTPRDPPTPDPWVLWLSDTRHFIEGYLSLACITELLDGGSIDSIRELRGASVRIVQASLLSCAHTELTSSSSSSSTSFTSPSSSSVSANAVLPRMRWEPDVCLYVEKLAYLGGSGNLAVGTPQQVGCDSTFLTLLQILDAERGYGTSSTTTTTISLPLSSSSSSSGSSISSSTASTTIGHSGAASTGAGGFDTFLYAVAPRLPIADARILRIAFQTPSSFASGGGGGAGKAAAGGSSSSSHGNGGMSSTMMIITKLSLADVGIPPHQQQALAKGGSSTSHPAHRLQQEEQKNIQNGVSSSSSSSSSSSNKGEEVHHSAMDMAVPLVGAISENIGSSYGVEAPKLAHQPYLPTTGGVVALMSTQMSRGSPWEVEISSTNNNTSNNATTTATQLKQQQLKQEDKNSGAVDEQQHLLMNDNNLYDNNGSIISPSLAPPLLPTAILASQADIAFTPFDHHSGGEGKGALACVTHNWSSSSQLNDSIHREQQLSTFHSAASLEHMGAQTERIDRVVIVGSSSSGSGVGGVIENGGNPLHGNFRDHAGHTEGEASSMTATKIRRITTNTYTEEEDGHDEHERIISEKHTERVGGIEDDRSTESSTVLASTTNEAEGTEASSTGATRIEAIRQARRVKMAKRLLSKAHQQTEDGEGQEEESEGGIERLKRKSSAEPVVDDRPKGENILPFSYSRMHSNASYDDDDGIPHTSNNNNMLEEFGRDERKGDDENDDDEVVQVVAATTIAVVVAAATSAPTKSTAVSLAPVEVLEEHEREEELGKDSQQELSAVQSSSSLKRKRESADGLLAMTEKEGQREQKEEEEDIEEELFTRANSTTDGMHSAALAPSPAHAHAESGIIVEGRIAEAPTSTLNQDRGDVHQHISQTEQQFQTTTQQVPFIPNDENSLRWGTEGVGVEKDAQGRLLLSQESGCELHKNTDYIGTKIIPAAADTAATTMNEVLLSAATPPAISSIDTVVEGGATTGEREEREEHPQEQHLESVVETGIRNPITTEDDAQEHQQKNSQRDPHLHQQANNYSQQFTLPSPFRNNSTHKNEREEGRCTVPSLSSTAANTGLQTAQLFESSSSFASPQMSLKSTGASSNSSSAANNTSTSTTTTTRSSVSATSTQNTSATVRSSNTTTSKTFMTATTDECSGTRGMNADDSVAITAMIAPTAAGVELSASASSWPSLLLSSRITSQSQHHHHHHSSQLFPHHQHEIISPLHATPFAITPMIGVSSNDGDSGGAKKDDVTHESAESGNLGTQNINNIVVEEKEKEDEKETATPGILHESIVPTRRQPTVEPHQDVRYFIRHHHLHRDPRLNGVENMLRNLQEILICFDPKKSVTG